MKIIITGPESSGKTSLAKALSVELKGYYIEEYARRYLNELGKPYEFEDILAIAQGQIQLEEQAAKAAEGPIICDTGLLVCKIWQQFKYAKLSPWIKENFDRGLHTLVLLDIQADKNRYMTANEGLGFLLQMEKNIGGNLFNSDRVVCVVARAGSDEPLVLSDCLSDLKDRDFGPPFHSIVVPGRLHFMEIEALRILAQLPAQQVEKLQKI